MKRALMVSSLVAAGATAAVVTGTAHADPMEVALLQEAIYSGKTSLELRLRDEYVNDPTKKREANAETLRSVLGYKTADYHGFKAVLAGLGWDIGLAPLRPIAYNRYKTPTKWVEYAEAGIATIVSDSEVYQPMIQADAALAATPEQWETAMRRLIAHPETRRDIVSAADRLLRSSYGWDRLEAGVLGLLRRVERATLAA